MTNFIKHPVTNWDQTAKFVEQKLIAEEPLSIRVQGKPYSVIMRTPGDEKAHVAGFCLGEGLVEDPDDFNTLGFCEDEDLNVVTVTLKPARRDKIAQHLERRGFISQTSCGICGKEVIKDLYQLIRPVENNSKVDINRALQSLDGLSDIQPLRDLTQTCHAAVIYDSDFKLLSVAEDVGRHNALDKAIGKLFLAGRLHLAALLILSSRISYELVQKAAQARIPIILGMSRPTSLAVQLASQLNITLACLSKESGMDIFCGAHRLI
ncbi:MAG: formate dehydrogenase accessory sulfurtransferase FdhD [Desulfobacterales bacterium]|nr:formate dehydrogenase accessory sulfurtransferase FdhD [Desulfobacterales bacterium]